MKNKVIFFLTLLLLYACSKSEENIPAPPKGSSIGLNKSDSLAMIAIYQKIGPWGLEWDLHDAMTWGGVEAKWDEQAGEYRICGFNYAGSFHGTIPEEFMQLTELEYLGLGGGELTGEIPSWIGSMKKLEWLFIGNNKIYGTIPPEIGNLTNLKSLILTNNKLSGKLPPEIGNLKQLHRITISFTNIEGEIPKEIAKLSNLELLDLMRNRLSGRFPIEILTHNYAIDCSYNLISELPLEVWKIENVKSFPDLQYNNLSGELPEWVFETEQWKINGGFVGRQNEGYGYTNYKDPHL